MMKKFSLTLLVITLSIFVNYGQKYGNIWHFGDSIGIDFNSCTPIALRGANAGFEGCSSICDSTGQLQFYTNSDQVWDRSNQLMPNGNLIASSGTLSQVIIVPKPLSGSIYYIITTKIQAQGSLTLQYHEVDMSLNGGLGDVSSSNNVLSTLNITEQISATYHQNGTDIWLMTHEYASNHFLAFLVTSSGISNTPVVSAVGPAHASCTSNFNARGEIKFSPDGNYLAFNGNGIGGADSTNILTLFNFNTLTGTVSNPVNLPYSRGEFGLSFSPDHSKLYGTTWKAFMFTASDYNYLYQFDLSSGVPATIAASKQILDSVPVPDGYGTLKIGPDGKIYVRRLGTGYIGVINAPNLAGVSCNYARNGFYVGTPSYQYGLNNYIEYTNYCTSLQGIESSSSTQAFAVFPNPFTSQTTLQFNVSFDQAQLTLFNLLGQPILQIANITGNTYPLYRGNLPSGIYVMQLTKEGKMMGSQKLIVTD